MRLSSIVGARFIAPTVRARFIAPGCRILLVTHGRDKSGPYNVIAPVALSTWIVTDESGVGAGPFTTAAAFAGSNSAPWQGQTINCWLGSYSTWQPAWVQSAS